MITRDEAAYRLAESFVKEYKKYDFKTFSLKNVEKTKWWIYFQKAADYRVIEGWTPEVYIKCLFEKYGKILPFRIVGKNAEKAFQEYKHRYEESDPTLYIKGMLETYKKIKQWSLDNGFEESNYIEFFNNTNNIERARRSQFSIYFLSICRPFIELNQEQEILDRNTLTFKRMSIASNKKVFAKMKEVLGENFY